MSLDVKKDWEDLKSAAVRGIADVFPIEGRRHVLSVSDVSVDDNKDMEDFEDQLTTKLQGKTWAVPIKGNVYLHDKDTGTLLNKRKLVLGHLPKTTPRFSYIVDGNEYQVDHLWVRKPGVYSRISEAGDLQSEFNLAKGRNFKLGFDPTKKDFHMEIAKNKIPLYPILKNLNVDEKILLKTWGKDVIENARKHNDITALKKLNRALGGGPETRDAIVLKMLNSLDQTQLDPTTTEITLGRPFEKVTPHTMVAATEKLINISKGVEDPDDRDSLIFKKLQGVDDKIYDRLAGKNKFRIDAKIRNRIDKYSEAKDVLGPSFFDKFIKHQFLGSGKEGSVLSNVTPQTNPIDWMQGATKTTILAPEEGGVASEHQIISEMKKVDPSHMGFLDPIQTPESSRSGITLYLPIGTKKEGEKVFTPVFDKNDKRMKYIDPLTFFKSTVAFPDQVTKEGTNINPVSREVRASLPGNKMTYSPWKDVQYVIANPASIFSVGTNLVPFVNANSGSRTALVSRNMSQSIPLVERTAPLVQVSAQEHKGGDISWEEFLGSTIALRSPATGIVKRVTNNKIEIETPKGTVAKQIYDYFPLNEDGSFVNHIPLVKPGDRVKEGDIISDTNFTKDGTLALGTNLRIAWTTIPGKTFEDGLVVSESAAKKLQAERLYRYTFEDSDDVVYDKNKFRAYYPTAFGQSQLQKLSDSGIITKGQVLQPDDPIVTSMTKTAPLSESKLIQRLGRSTIKPYRDTSIKWDGAVPGEVLDVKRVGKRTTVLVKATEPARVADKLSSRYGSKGVISDIFSDSEMPKDAEGRPIDIIISPLAVPSRLNIGHIYEALTGKVAEKTGKPIKVPSFTINNYHTWIENLLKKHKLSDTETLYAPDGRPLGNVMTGTSHILRLKQVVEDKYSDRSGGPGSAYDINKSPAGESGHKGQAMGELDQYALLSHGARNIITDAHTRASDADQADEVWRALQLGLPLPPPRIPFVYRKFENYLKGLGVNLKKGYGKLSLAPMTDADVKNLAVGEIKNPETLRSKDLQPVPGGLFDPRVTKGMGGDSWAYYKLPEPMPNPVFEEGIRALTGLTKEELNQVIKGERGLPLPLKKTSAITVGPDEGLTGPEGLKAYMDALNVDKEIDESLAALPKLTGSGLNKVHKRIRTLQALKTYGMKPSEAYMMQNVPVVPPVMRPVMVKPDGNLSIDNLNELYRGMIITSQVYDDAKGYLPAPQLGALRGELYDGLKALSGVTSKKRAQGDELKGILDTLSGETPKGSFFQNNLMKRRQDLSARSVISPDPSLGIDEVRLPRKMAMTVYKPFVVRELHSMGIPPLYAQKMIDSNSPLSFSALDKVVKERPVLLKRDPVLHKYGIMAFRPVLHEGKEIAISPLIVGPYGADFDGDQMAVYSPISPEAVKEAWGMLPSKNLFSPASGQVAYKPSHESVAGLFRMTHTGKATNKAFSNLDDAKKAFYDKNVAVDDIVTIGDTKTTVGRAMLYDALPAPVKDEKILTDFNTVFDKKGISNFLENVGRVNPSWYSDTAKTMLNLGNQVLYDTGYSLSLDDLKPDLEARKKFIDPIKKQLKYIDPGKMIGMLGTASKKMLEYHQKKMEKNPTDLYLTTLSGKPSLNQYQQLVMTPVLFSDMGGTSIPNPVSRSYSEGLEFGDYWLQNIGSRRDIVGKVSEVREPGALTKRMVNTLIGTVVTKDDCGTTEGEALGIGHPDLVDRFLSKPIEVGGSKISAGTLITPEFVNVMKRSGVASIPVRSPLHCHADDGICAKCYGLIDNNMTPKIGDNVGVMAAQSIGERATQLSLKRVHHAGAYGGSSKIMDGFSRMDQLARLPEKIPDTAVLSTASGKITDVKKSPVGGYDVFINGQAHYVPLKLGLVPGVKSGAQVKKGDPLSQGNVNPRDLLELSGIEAVRKMMTDEMDNLYDGSVRRRNFEVFVNGLTSLVQVTDPGEATEVLRGDVMPLSRVKALNSELSDKIRYKPILKGVDMAPHDIHDDWIARLNHIRLKGTLLDAINRGLTSNIHSLHPIPALVSGQILDQGAEY